jgi:hypothetical protein
MRFKDYEVEGIVNPSEEQSTIIQEVQAAVAQVLAHEKDSCIAFESLLLLGKVYSWVRIEIPMSGKMIEGNRLST